MGVNLNQNKDMIDLNCYSFCEDVVLVDDAGQPLVADADGQIWEVKTPFNGRKGNIKLAFDNGEPIKFSAMYLPNDAAILYFDLFKSSQFVNKYKIKIYPQV